ncbi:lamin tail domain-containing protein [Patescibacteria group bacterium]|nr:lamin tail domain-containing protein [Patescibacteria group bacterium]
MKPIEVRQQKRSSRATAKERISRKASPGFVFGLKKESLLKIGVVTLLIGFSWVGLSTVRETIAFYLDSETSAGNLFDAALLDFELASPADFAPEVSGTEDAERQISVTDIQSIAFHYRVQGENFVGPLCGVLNLQAFLKNDQKYSGPLVDFQAGDFGFAQPEDWEYVASLTTSNPDFHGTTCQFDLVHSGWQIQFPILFSGFHDIETIPSLIAAKVPQCNALSQGYWRNNEGCSKGQGISGWTVEINNLSSSYSGVFSSITGEGICESLWTPNCSGGNTPEAKLCKAKAHTLANELNIVSGRQDTAALLAGADDGFPAFNNLGLSPSSTVQEAIEEIEAILANPFASVQQLGDAAHVAERIYTFYEEENPLAPLCVFDLNDLPSIESGGGSAVLEGSGEETEEPVEPKKHGNVVLNEIMPNPEGDDSQPGLDGEWIELYNLEDYPVDLKGWYLELASDPENMLVITGVDTHTSGTIIGKNGSGSEWLVVFVEETILNNVGDTISLYDLSNKLQDSHTYSAFADDADEDTNESGGESNEETLGIETLGNEGKSTARIPDGTGEWIDPVPTPGGPNKLEEDVEESQPLVQGETGEQETLSEEEEAPENTETEGGDETAEEENTEEPADTEQEPSVVTGNDETPSDTEQEEQTSDNQTADGEALADDSTEDTSVPLRDSNQPDTPAESDGTSGSENTETESTDEILDVSGETQPDDSQPSGENPPADNGGTEEEPTEETPPQDNSSTDEEEVI